MDGPREYYASEISPTEKDKYYMISLICSLKNNINKYIHKTEKLSDKLMVIKGEREVWTDKLKIWNKRIQTTKHK